MTTIFSLFLQLSEAHATSRDELVLNVGQQQLISQGERIKRVAIGNAQVINVKSLKEGNELLVTGKSPGSSDLIIWYGKTKKAFSFYVLARDLQTLAPNLELLLHQLEGVEARQVGKELWIEGEILRPNDRLLIRKLCESNPLLRDMTKMHPQAIELTAEYMRQQLQQAGYPHVKVSAVAANFFVEGVVNSVTEAKKVEELLKPIYPEIEFHLDSLYGNGEMIFMDVKMVEMRQSAMQKLGIAWQKSITGNFNSQWSDSGTSTTLGLAEAIPISLQTLEQKGLARILSNPKLSCRYDIACTFQAGGEIPIPLIGERSVNVIFKNYGIQLSIVPHLSGDDRLVIAIDMEFSDVNYATAVNGIPGLLKNSLKTSASVRFNNSVVLSGLIQYRQGKDVDKMPMLGSLPIVGELFKNRGRQQDQSEFLLFLTPLPMFAGDSNSQNLIDQQSDSFQKMGKKMEYHLND
jgi:pilus assembly protein CpaC